MSLFRKKPPPTQKEILRAQKQDLNRQKRSLERDILNLERQEKQTEAEIKRLAQRGDMTSARLMAKELVRIRQQKQHLRQMTGTVTAVNTRTQVAATTGTLANAMAGATRAMSFANSQTNPAQLQQIMSSFDREVQKAEMADEMLDEMFDDEVDEAETDQVVSQVFDEIGLDVSAMLSANGPSKAALPSEQVAEQAKTRTALTEATGDVELDKLLAQLRA